MVSVGRSCFRSSQKRKCPTAIIPSEAYAAFEVESEIAVFAVDGVVDTDDRIGDETRHHDFGFRPCYRFDEYLFLFLGVIGNEVRDEQEIAAKAVDVGDYFAFFKGHFDVVVAENENVGVVEPRSSVEVTSENGVLQGVLRGNVLAVHRFVAPLQTYVRAYAHKIDFAEGRGKGRAAAEDDFIAATFANEVHSVAHNFSAALVVHRIHTTGVQKVEFDHIEAPFVEHDVENLFDVSPRFGVVYVQGIEAAPVCARIAALAFFVPGEPVLVLFIYVRFRRHAERRKPKPRKHTGGVDFVHDVFHSAGELVFFDFEPVAHGALIPVVYLENVDFGVDFRHRLKVADNDFFGYRFIVVVPGGVAATSLDPRLRDVHHSEVLVENRVIVSFQGGNFENDFFTVEKHALEVFFHCHGAVVRVVGYEGVA